MLIFLELGGYVAKESIEDVKTGPNLTDEERNEFTDTAKQFTNLFTEAPGATDLVQYHIKLISDEPVRPYPEPYSIGESLRTLSKLFSVFSKIKILQDFIILTFLSGIKKT